MLREEYGLPRIVDGPPADRSSGAWTSGFVDRQVADPVAVFLDDDDSSLGEFEIDSRKHDEKSSDTFRNGVADAAQKEDARAGGSCQRQDRAEVGVGGDEDTILGQRKCHDLVVSAACETEKPDVAGVVPLLSQVMCHGILECFVDQESHAV